MDKNIIKITGLIVGLVVFVGILIYLLIAGINIGPIHAVSVSGITEKGEGVEKARTDLELAETNYKGKLQALEKSKKEFNEEKEDYELISDAEISAVKEATKEEEYLIEYLWITLGNYATKHNLEVAIVEPGGSAGGQGAAGTADTTDATNVSTGTGVQGNASGVTNTTSNNSGTNKTDAEQDKKEETTTSVTAGLTASADALTVQIKGSYIDLADFIFEVENDRELRFRLDNIKMTSAGGTQVITSFNVKDFTVLKSLGGVENSETPEGVENMEGLE